jgi:hypothetical protein
MTKMWGFGFVVVAALCLTGCGGGGGDAGFEQQWKALYPAGNMVTAKQHAQQVCALFKSGATYQDAITYDKGTSPVMTDANARDLVAVATVNYCPDYKDKH